MTRLTETERERIRSLGNDGLTQNEIADEMDCSQATVSLVLGSGQGLQFTHANEYECVKDGYRSGPVYMHRLLATVDHSLDELRGKHIHHKNGFGWDNRPENLEVVTVTEHQEIHDNV